MTPINLDTAVRAYPGRYRTAPRAQGFPRPQTLAEAVEFAVDHLDATCLSPLADAPAGPAFEARTLLGLLTFCYARQVYSSAEIASQLDRELRPLQVNDDPMPDASVLKRFRAENREPLVFCLRSALLFLAEEKIRQGLVTHVKPSHMHQEANRRIIMAMFTDSLETEPKNRDCEHNFGFGVAIRRGRVQ